VRALAPLLAALAGCAVPIAPPRDLLDAQRVLARAEASPFADAAATEIAEAEAALTAAEKAHAARPGSARAADGAYVALRAAEAAEIAGRCAAERIALEKARGAASHFASDLERRDAFFASLARRRAAQARAQAELREAHRAALERARGPKTELFERGDALVFRIAVEEIFLPGTSLLRDGAAPRLAALAHALTAALPVLVRVAIVNDADGFKTPAAVLGERRARRVHDLLRAFGVPAGVLLPPERRPLPGAQVDVIVIEPELPLPADE
jgi:outer membrane protein OmpA-like peptidoglycan-associated protein